jgi:hypothetical protein
MEGLPKDVLTLLLSHLIAERDCCAVDAVSRAFLAANGNGGWKSFVQQSLGLRRKSDGRQTWRAFVLERVRPLYRQLSLVCGREGGKQTRKLDDILARYDPLPEESAIVLGLVSHYGFVSFDNRKDARSPFDKLQFDGEWDTDSFLYIGEPALGGGDTQWWVYLVVKGSVRCPAAPRQYCTHRWNEEERRVLPRNVREFGPGSVVVFSLHNHAGGPWDAAHLPPSYGGNDEFGVEPLYERECDEWVRVNVEQPIGVSMDAPPCAWPSFSAFLEEVNRSFREYRREKNFTVMLNAKERVALWAERWKVSAEEAKRRLDEL